MWDSFINSIPITNNTNMWIQISNSTISQVIICWNMIIQKSSNKKGCFQKSKFDPNKITMKLICILTSMYQQEIKRHSLVYIFSLLCLYNHLLKLFSIRIFFGKHYIWIPKVILSIYKPTNNSFLFMCLIILTSIDTLSS